jgi:hypothetical protein
MTGRLAGLAALVALGMVALAPADAMAQAPSPRVEYIDIRWDGVDRMCVIYPDGRVEFLGKEMNAIPRPDDANKRAFYMTIAMGRMIAKGYEFVAIISDEIIMKRPIN